jgi:uncharacterized membrane protein YkvA (DUF1232 family)
MLARWKAWARGLRIECRALYLACRDPRVPWYAKAFAACVAAYAFSPIDLIPDPIPVLGYLDDLILVPLGILLARRMIPPAVMAEARGRAAQESEARPTSWAAAAAVIAVWIAVGLAFALWLAGDRSSQTRADRVPVDPAVAAAI